MAGLGVPEIITFFSWLEDPWISSGNRFRGQEKGSQAGDYG
jgi:hypothetical protein